MNCTSSPRFFAPRSESQENDASDSTQDIMDLYEYLGYSRADIARIIKDVPKSYRSFRIQKRSGKFRTIDAPNEILKKIQQDITHKILYLYRPHPIAHGFIKSRGPISNAEKHVGKKLLISMDVKDFFPSLNEARVLSTLEFILPLQDRFESTSEDAVVLSKLMCLNHSLPQGAPSSPAMSNIMCRNMDKALKVLEDKYECDASRYADDIAVSTNHVTRKEALIAEMKKIITDAGFKLNVKKINIRGQWGRMMVTGINVNTTLSIKKSTCKNLRAKLHKHLIQDVPLTQDEFNKTRGLIEWIRSVNRKKGMQLLDQLLLLKVIK